MIPTSLYRMRDAAGRLLYVGITTRGGQRISQHRRSQPWWPDVARIDVDHFDSIAEAVAAEETAIRTERPAYNRRSAGPRPRRPFRHAPSGQQIRAARRAAGLSQCELADLLGVSQPAVSSWENGHALPDMNHVTALRDLFGEVAA